MEIETVSITAPSSYIMINGKTRWEQPLNASWTESRVVNSASRSSNPMLWTILLLPMQSNRSSRNSLQATLWTILSPLLPNSWQWSSLLNKSMVSIAAKTRAVKASIRTKILIRNWTRNLIGLYSFLTCTTSDRSHNEERPWVRVTRWYQEVRTVS